MAEADPPRAGDRERTCTTCGYSLAGLAAVGSINGAEIWRCPECGARGPMDARSLRKRRLITASVRIVAGFVLFVTMFVCGATLSMHVAGVSARPFALELGQSELAFYARGELNAEIDLSGFTPDVERQLFEKSGGWRAALWPEATLVLTGATIGSFLSMMFLSKVSAVLRGWRLLAWLMPALLLVAILVYLHHFFSSNSSSTGHWAITLAGCRIGTPMAFITVGMLGAACLLGARVGGRRMSRMRSRSSSK